MPKEKLEQEILREDTNLKFIDTKASSSRSVNTLLNHEIREKIFLETSPDPNVRTGWYYVTEKHPDRYVFSDLLGNFVLRKYELTCIKKP